MCHVGRIGFVIIGSDQDPIRHVEIIGLLHRVSEKIGMLPAFWNDCDFVGILIQIGGPPGKCRIGNDVMLHH